MCALNLHNVASIFHILIVLYFCLQGKGKSALNLSNVAGIFHILIGGLVLSMIIALSQIVYHSHRKNKSKQVRRLPLRSFS